MNPTPKDNPTADDLKPFSTGTFRTLIVLPRICIKAYHKGKALSMHNFVSEVLFTMEARLRNLGNSPLVQFLLQKPTQARRNLYWLVNAIPEIQLHKPEIRLFPHPFLNGGHFPVE